VGQGKKLGEPLGLGVSIFFDIIPALSPQITAQRAMTNISNKRCRMFAALRSRTWAK
jgi:hypothetical protein